MTDLALTGVTSEGPPSHPEAPARPEFEIVPRKGLIAVGMVFVLVVVAIAANQLWPLIFLHVAGGAAWTIVDLFLGLILVLRAPSRFARGATHGWLADSRSRSPAEPTSFGEDFPAGSGPGIPTTRVMRRLATPPDRSPAEPVDFTGEFPAGGPQMLAFTRRDGCQ